MEQLKYIRDGKYKISKKECAVLEIAAPQLRLCNPYNTL
jgi:hypothetical protein